MSANTTTTTLAEAFARTAAAALAPRAGQLRQRAERAPSQLEVFAAYCRANAPGQLLPLGAAARIYCQQRAAEGAPVGAGATPDASLTSRAYLAHKNGTLPAGIALTRADGHTPYAKGQGIAWLRID